MQYQSILRFLIRSFLGMAGGACLALVVTHFIPREYQCTAELKVRIPAALQPEKEDLRFSASRAFRETFEGHSVASKISKKLNLPERWRMKNYQVLAELREIISVDWEGDMLTLLVRHSDPAEALEITNAVLSICREHLAEKIGTWTELRVDGLLAAQREVIREYEDRTEIFSTRLYEWPGYSLLLHLKDTALLKRMHET